MTTHTSGAADLRTAAQAVVDRWDTPLWKDAPSTAEYIGRLRAALAAGQATAQAVVPEALDAIADSQYLAGVTAGFNAAQATDPNAALQKIHDSRAGYLKPLRARAAAPAQPAAQQPQGVAYAALPEPDPYWGGGRVTAGRFSAEDMRAFADRTHALRVASHGQAPAQPIEVCMSTPPGWRCTRKAGHEGPCAAVRCPEELEFVARGMARLKAAEAGPQATPSPQAAQQALAPTVTFEDPRVQIVYQTIIDDSDWPPKDGPQHWDGWISRRIVDRLFAPVEPQAPAGAQVDSQTTPELPPLPDPDLRDVGIRPQDIKDFLKGYATEYARAALATCSQADSVQEGAFSILEAVSRCFTTDDALPDNLLPRIDALIAARAAQKEGEKP